MFDQLGKNQPPFSMLELIVIWFVASIPYYIGKMFAYYFGFSGWQAVAVGLILMAACMLGYSAFRRNPSN